MSDRGAKTATETKGAPGAKTATATKGAPGAAAKRKPQPYKVEAVGAIKEALAETTNVYFADYRGLTVTQLGELRGQLRESDSRFAVIKNRYAKIALQELGLEELAPMLEGPTALALVKGDVSAVSKTLVGFGKDAPLEVKGGYIEGRALSLEDVVVLSKLPSRTDLYAMLLGAMNGPVRNLGFAMSAVLQGLGRVMQAVAEQKR